jgi:bacterioferritin (cytochrome b1)
MSKKNLLKADLEAQRSETETLTGVVKLLKEGAVFTAYARLKQLVADKERCIKRLEKALKISKDETEVEA